MDINKQGKQSISLNNSLNKTTNSHSDLKIVLDNTRSYPQDRKYDDNLKRNKTISTIMNSKHYKYISRAQNNNLGAIFSTIMLFWCRLEKRNEKINLGSKIQTSKLLKDSYNKLKSCSTNTKDDNTPLFMACASVRQVWFKPT